MGVAFTPGQTLGRGDLDIFLTNTAGNVSNAYTITFAIYWVDPVSNAEVLIGPSARQPVNPAVGEYYAAIMIPTAATPGTYHIRWTFKQYSSDPDSQVVQEFAVVAAGSNTGAGTSTTSRSTCQQDLIRKLRFLIRDNAPDRNYKFRPPQGEGTIGCYNRVFGYIWEDEELAEYLEIALWKWNAHPPETEELCSVDVLCQRKPAWKAALLWGALVNAAQALAYNWVSEEFSVAGETMVAVVLPDGREVVLPIAELHSICAEGGEQMTDENTRTAIREAFRTGALKVRAVNSDTGCVGLHTVADVMQHHTGDRASVTCMTADGRSVTTTCDHSLFHPRGGGVGLTPVRADALRTGDQVAEVNGDVLQGVSVEVSVGAPLAVSYDLCVPGPENFVLANGIVAHNSYSIGGISLDLDRSSKYMDLKRNAEEQWDKLTEAKARTTKYIRGLQQPRFGIGIRSAFGPATGRGVLSPRNFLVVFLGLYAGSGVGESEVKSDPAGVQGRLEAFLSVP